MVAVGGLGLASATDQINQASAARDVLFYFGLTNWPQTHLESYRINNYGDTLSYLFEHDRVRLEEDRRIRSRAFHGVAGECPAGSASYTEILLSEIDRAKLAEVSALAARDGARIILMRHDSSLGSLAASEPEYRAGLEALVSAVREALGNVTVLAPAGFVPQPYEIADAMHLNRGGAERLTHRLAALLAARPAPAEPPAAAYRDFTKRDFNDYGPFAGMVVKPAGKLNNWRPGTTPFLLRWPRPNRESWWPPSSPSACRSISTLRATAKWPWASPARSASIW